MEKDLRKSPMLMEREGKVVVKLMDKADEWSPKDHEHSNEGVENNDGVETHKFLVLCQVDSNEGASSCNRRLSYLR
jgi:hypothetical protein